MCARHGRTPGARNPQLCENTILPCHRRSFLKWTQFEGEWRAVKGSRYFNSPLLYKENGFQKKEDAQKLIEELSMQNPLIPHVLKMERKKENKNAPLLYNLAELQNDCARFFKISPDETLKVVQELYEKKLVTYPRTDARVLSSAVAREISKNLRGLQQYGICSGLANEILQGESWKKIGSTRYTNDKQITDHYAIIPTGQGLNNLRNLSELSAKVYETIVRRFLGIFYPPASIRSCSCHRNRRRAVFLQLPCSRAGGLFKSHAVFFLP